MISPNFTSAFNTEEPRGMNSEIKPQWNDFSYSKCGKYPCFEPHRFVLKDASTKCQLNHLSTEIRLMFGVFNHRYFVQRSELWSHQSAMAQENSQEKKKRHEICFAIKRNVYIMFVKRRREMYFYVMEFFRGYIYMILCYFIQKMRSLSNK